MAYAVWQDSAGVNHVVVFVEGKEDKAIATLKRDGHMAVDAVLTFNGPIPPDPIRPPVITLEQRLAALETKVDALSRVP